MDESSEESLIEGSPCQTPVAKKLKKIRNRARCRRKIGKTVKGNETDLLEQLVEEFSRNVTQCDIQNKKTDQKTFFSVQDNEENVTQYNSKQPTESASSDNAPECVATEKLTEINTNKLSENGKSEKNNETCRGITEPIQKPISKNYHNLYVFYTIEEILEFTPNNFPKNGCVQLIGTFQFLQRSNSYILCSFERSYMQSHQVKLDTRELCLKPQCEEMITLFGVISFDNNTPIIIAKFFQKSAVPYQIYVDLMLRLRTTVPQENFIKIYVTDDDLRCDETVEEDCNEEEFLTNITEKLNGEIFETNEMSDSKLGAFLDDISFESL